jgi:enoyl-CoA hydratase
MSYRNLLLEPKGPLTILKINRPDKLNALNGEIIDELWDAFSLFKNDDSVKAVIITGSGEKAFVAGADISELNKLNMISAKVFAEKGQSVFNLIESMDKPVIAAVNGFALGGGCELALACHIRIASENAKFGQPEVNLGIIPGYGGTQRLARLINAGRAMEYILTGDMIDANEALHLGIVSHVYPLTELPARAEEMANKIISKARHAVRHAIKAVTATKEISQREGMNYEASLFALCCGTEDFKEGTSAFMEKRKAEFKDR